MNHFEAEGDTPRDVHERFEAAIEDIAKEPLGFQMGLAQVRRIKAKNDLEAAYTEYLNCVEYANQRLHLAVFSPWNEQVFVHAGAAVYHVRKKAEALSTLLEEAKSAGAAHMQVAKNNDDLKKALKEREALNGDDS